MPRSNSRDRSLKGTGGKRTRRVVKRRAVRYRVCRTEALAAAESMKFMVPVRGAGEECFVINLQGHYHAYVNRCRHLPNALDWVGNQFFPQPGRSLYCAAD